MERISLGVVFLSIQRIHEGWQWFDAFFVSWVPEYPEAKHIRALGQSYCF